MIICRKHMRKGEIMDTQRLLNQLISKVITGHVPDQVNDIYFDSRAVTSNSIFVALKGYTVDSHRFVHQAIAKGAKVLIVAQPVEVDLSQVAVVTVPNTSVAAIILANALYDSPSLKLNTVGITGTNGKTSVSTMIHHVLRALNQGSALSGTNGIYFNEQHIKGENTTPDIITTQQNLVAALKHDIHHFTFEVSSHGLVLGRLSGVDFDIAVFTNLTHDHLDFHQTMANYAHAKSLLFSGLGQDLSRRKFGIINLDDEWAPFMIEACAHPVLTYSIKDAQADFYARDIQASLKGSTFTLHCPEGQYLVTLPFIGDFMVANALAAMATLWCKGIALVDIIKQISHIPSIDGRVENLDTTLPINLILDYAHTPDAVDKLLSAVLPYKKQGKVILLLGLAGGRDLSKGEDMANAASRADYVIFTSDNPIDTPWYISTDAMSQGMPHQNYIEIKDRAKAIAHAIELSQVGDTIILASKGREHEQKLANYQSMWHDDAVIALNLAQQKYQL